MAQELLTYFGTYTNGGKSKGIYCYKLDLATWQADERGRDRGDQESVVSGDSSERQVPVCGERGERRRRQAGRRGERVCARPQDRQADSRSTINRPKGQGPCHVSVDKTGKVALVANYGSGSIASLPIKADGSLEKAAVGDSARRIERRAKGRQDGAARPFDQRLARQPLRDRGRPGARQGADLQARSGQGDADANDPAFAKTPAGGGPRHFAFHPSGRFAYNCNEITSSVTAYAYDASKGALTEIQTITTLPEADEGQLDRRDSGPSLAASSCIAPIAGTTAWRFSRSTKRRAS